MIFGSALIAVILLACPFTAQPEPPAPLPSIPPQPSASPAVPINESQDEKTEQDWALITKANVEDACLSQAKKAAADSGYDEGVVFSCGCSAQESAGEKSYDCIVSALDGAHGLGVACTKSLKSCTISAQGSQATFTFAQLQALGD